MSRSGIEREPNANARAVVLLSGGLDSATTLAIAQDRGFEAHALTIDYGQRHACELEAAQAVARAARAAAHRVLRLDLRMFGGSALTSDVPVPHGGPLGNPDSIPITYVPARNTIMLSIALAYAEVIEAQAIFIGANAVDYSGYPDCRPEFIAAFQEVARLGTRAGQTGKPIRIEAPLISLSKAEIVRIGLTLGVDFSLTRSCYAPDDRGRACGRCDSCRIRLAAFDTLDIADPSPYVTADA